MTSRELLERMKPVIKRYQGQLVGNKLSVNLSEVFTEFVKQAAKCERFNSDIYYDMRLIDELFENFNKDTEHDPIWVGFRDCGVDGTSFVLIRAKENNIRKTYFALYSIEIVHDFDCFYDIVLTKYPM